MLPGCLATKALCTAKPGCVATSWQNFCISRGGNATKDTPQAWEKFKNLGAEPGEVKPSRPQILAKCELYFLFNTVSKQKFYSHIKDATGHWKGKCVEARGQTGRYLASGRGAVEFPNGSSFQGEFQSGKAWNGSGSFWSEGGSVFKGELRNGKPWQGKEEKRDFEAGGKFVAQAVYENGRGAVSEKPDTADEALLGTWEGFWERPLNDEERARYGKEKTGGKAQLIISDYLGNGRYSGTQVSYSSGNSFSYRHSAQIYFDEHSGKVEILFKFISTTDDPDLVGRTGIATLTLNQNKNKLTGTSTSSYPGRPGATLTYFKQ